MGSRSSKETRTETFLPEQDIPIGLSHDAIQQLIGADDASAATDTKPPVAETPAVVVDAESEAEKEDKLNALIEERVERELAKRRHLDVKQQQLALEQRNLHAASLRTDIEQLLGRQRVIRNPELHPELLRRQEAVMECYRRYQDKPLQCREEVRDFRYAVERASMEELRKQVST